MRVLAILTLLTLMAPPAPAGEADAAAGGVVVLGDRSVWRTHFTFRTTGGEDYPNCSYRSPLPPEDWAGPEFDDSGWARWRIGVNHGPYYAYGIMEDGALSHALQLICLRGRFTVNDPAGASLVLDLSYRGGVAVYVNGKEVRRQHLPADAGTDALAEAYPKEAWYKPEGMPLPSVGSSLRTTYKDRVETRVRRLEKLAIPAPLLRKGVNVLAVAIHGAPFEEKVRARNDGNYPCLWGPCGPIGLCLAGGPGAVANSGRPRGLQVWTAGADVRPSPADYADPHEKLRPIFISGTRNGIFCGQVVVSSDAAIGGLRAEISDLKQAEGPGAIPAAAVEVLYAYWRDGRYGAPFLKEPNVRSAFFDPLSEDAPAEVKVVKGDSREADPDLGAVQPVWIKARVPADAPAGEYRGTLSVTAGGQKTDVPVRLTVAEWKLPDPKEYGSLAGLIQSPDSVALQYKVPLWSDQHFKLMEKSYELIGQAGGKFVWLPFLTRTNLGNTETIVRWIKGADGKLKPDFAVFDRYLDMVQRHLQPWAVCLYVYDRYTDYAGRSRATPERLKERGPDWKHRGMPGTDAWKISVLDPKTGAVTEELAPPWRKSTYDPAALNVTREELVPEARGFYEEVLKEARARLEKRGLGKVTMLGIEEDVEAKKSTHQFFEQIFPGVKWVLMRHPMLADERYGYESAVYLPGMPPPVPWDQKRTCGWQHQKHGGIFPRTGGVTYNYVSAASEPGLYRVLTEACQLTAMTRHHFPLQGLARGGADFWPVLGSDKIRQGITRSTTVVARFPETCWDQLNLDRSIECVLAPGPGGAIPTIRFESYREGIQECEARIFIERAVVGGKLDAAFAKKCQELLDERHNIIRAACIGGGDGGLCWYAASGSAGLAEKLFAAAAEVAAKTGR